MKALVWPVATYGCESWTLRKNEETRLDAFELKGLRKILLVSWTAKKTDEWVLNRAAVHHTSSEITALSKPSRFQARHVDVQDTAQYLSDVQNSESWYPTSAADYGLLTYSRVLCWDNNFAQ